MDHDRIDFIYGYFEEKQNDSTYVDDGFYIKIHAMFHCLDEEEIEESYFSYGRQNGSYRNTLESFISKRAAEKPKIAYVSVAQKLLDKVEQEKNFRKRLSYRTFLSRVISYMPEDLIKRYFDALISTGSSSDRNKVYDVVNFIWTDELKDTLVNLYLNFYEEKNLEILIEKLRPEELVSLVCQDELWEENGLRRRIKYAILKKIYCQDLNDIDFVKQDTSAYVYLLHLKKDILSEQEFIDLLQQLPESKNLNKIWFLGLSKRWDLLKDLV